VDKHLELERQRTEQDRLWQEAREKREREEAERVHQKLKAVLACIQPVRDFTDRLGLNMLRDCLEQLDQEERDRNVPANWQELAEKCERIGEWRLAQSEGSAPWENHLDSEPEVTKHGVKEEITYTRDDHPTYTQEYSLQEYINEFGDDYDEDHQEEEEED
jgi:hypothetical protein